MNTFLGCLAVSLLSLVGGSNIRILVAQDNIKFNTDVADIKSTQLGDVLSALNGHTVRPSDPWKGLKTYNPLQHPTLFLIADFELAKGVELTMNSNLKFRLENNDGLDEEFNEFKERSVERQPQAGGTMLAVDASEDMETGDRLKTVGSGSQQRLEEAKVILKDEDLDHENSAEDRAFMIEYYTLMMIGKEAAATAVEAKPSVAYWVNLNSLRKLSEKYGAKHPKTQRAAKLFSKLIGQVTGDLEAHPKAMFMVISEEELAPSEVLQRSRRQAEGGVNILLKDNKDADWNLAYKYDPEFHIVFAISTFTVLLIILAVLATSVGLWFMDPGRDSIIYRMTSTRMKTD